jgi:hypothetical protein
VKLRSDGNARARRKSPGIPAEAHGIFVGQYQTKAAKATMPTMKIAQKNNSRRSALSTILYALAVFTAWRNRIEFSPPKP